MTLKTLCTARSQPGAPPRPNPQRRAPAPPPPPPPPPPVTPEERRKSLAEFYSGAMTITVAVHRVQGRGFGIEVADLSCADGPVQQMIVRVFRGSAAETAGVYEGDGLVAVNGWNVGGSALPTIMDAIRNTQDTLELTLLRELEACRAGAAPTPTSNDDGVSVRADGSPGRHASNTGAASGTVELANTNTTTATSTTTTTADNAAYDGSPQKGMRTRQGSFSRRASVSSGQLGLQKSATVAVDIERPSPGTPLGFTLMGMGDGDANTHVVQTVSEGGLCANTLQFGDVIMAVNNRSASEMTHDQLTAELNRGNSNGNGNGISLVVARDYDGVDNEAGRFGKVYGGRSEEGDLALSGARWHAALEHAYHANGILRKSKVVMKW